MAATPSPKKPQYGAGILLITTEKHNPIASILCIVCFTVEQLLNKICIKSTEQHKEG